MRKGVFILAVIVLSLAVPALAQTHRYQVSAITAMQSGIVAPTFWYVRPDGGTRYSANMLKGQCDGKGDASYASTGGTGVNQHCAFNDARWLWQDGSYSTAGNFPSYGWVISGGDTVIIRGSIASGVSWRVGWNSANGALDPNGLYYGLQGDQYNSGIPVPPSGTALQHTRILGENYAACTSQSARTQLHGGWTMYQVLDLSGASYVDIGCLDITDFSDGITSSDSARNGIKLSNASTYDTLTDIRIHGLTTNGIFGPTGTGFVVTDIAIVGNGSAGWNADLSNGTTGVGSLLVQNYNISWNGCNEEYPIVDPLPYAGCRDDSTGGYGDGFGTASVDSVAPGWQITFTNGIASYNTQDALDALHVAGAGSTMTVTNSLFFGNEGQAIKAGGGAVATIRYNVIVANCEAITQTIPGRPVFAAGSPFLDSLGDVCRANSTAVLLNVIPGHPAAFQSNTLFSRGSVGLEVEYASSSNAAGSTIDKGPTNTLLYNDNVFVGFTNSGSQKNPSPIYSNSDLKMLTNPGASWTNNATFGGVSNWTCPAAGESKAICADPGLIDETYHPYGYGNMSPASASSAVVGAGVAYAGILPTDYSGAPLPTPPPIGALTVSATSAPPPVVPPPVVVPPPPVITPPPVVVTPPLAVTPVTQMANAYKICDEGCTITSMPPGTIYQFGAGTTPTWLPPATSTSSSPALPLLVYYTSFPVGAPTPIDPDSGVLKEFDVQQTTAAQTIVFTSTGSAVPVTRIVPALVPPCTRPIALQVKGATVYTGCAD